MKKSYLIFGSAFGLLACVGTASAFLIVDDETIAKAMCAGGNSYSCWSAGRYEHVRNDGHNETTLGFYEKSCAIGLGRSCNVVSGHYWTTNKQKPEDALDIEKAFYYIKLACEKGDRKSCHNMGYMIRGGLGVEKDKNAGIEIYKDMCAKDFADSCYNLGNSLSNVYYVADHQHKGYDDRRAALQYYLKACDLGLDVGCKKAAKSLEKGYSGRTDLDEADRLREEAESKKKDKQPLRVVGPTHTSRFDYFTCLFDSSKPPQTRCHPHLNVPQYVI